jgi:hypothetical protein
VWQLNDDYEFIHDYWTTVPAGFLTDFASAPLLLQWAIPQWGDYGRAALIHDWLYYDQSIERKTSDELFLQAMEVSGVDAHVRYILYASVRLLGWYCWYDNQIKKEFGLTKIKPMSRDILESNEIDSWDTTKIPLLTVIKRALKVKIT